MLTSPNTTTWALSLSTLPKPRVAAMSTHSPTRQRPLLEAAALAPDPVAAAAAVMALELQPALPPAMDRLVEAAIHHDPQAFPPLRPAASLPRLQVVDHFGDVTPTMTMTAVMDPASVLGVGSVVQPTPPKCRTANF